MKLTYNPSLEVAFIDSVEINSADGMTQIYMGNSIISTQFTKGVCFTDKVRLELLKLLSHSSAPAAETVTAAPAPAAEAVAVHFAPAIEAAVAASVQRGAPVASDIGARPVVAPRSPHQVGGSR